MNIALNMFSDSLHFDDFAGDIPVPTPEIVLGQKSLGEVFIADGLDALPSRDIEELGSAIDTETAELGSKFYHSQGVKAVSQTVDDGDLEDFMARLSGSKPTKGARLVVFRDGFKESAESVFDDLAA